MPPPRHTTRSARSARVARFARPARFAAGAAAGLIAAGLSIDACAALAADAPGSHDHPSISRFHGATLIHYQTKDFDEATLPVKAIANQGEMPTDALLHLEGKVTDITYQIPAGKSALEVMRNYQEALAAYKVVFKCAGDACGGDLAGFIGNSHKVMPQGFDPSFDTHKNRYVLASRSDPAGDTYVLLYAMEEDGNPTRLYEKVVEMKPMQGAQVTVVDAASLKRGLETEGKVAVYGVLFDTNRAEVKPESKPSLDEMAKLLAAQPALAVYIVGHTDNVGGLGGNLDLSQRRADAVANALATTYKIDKRRLVARGVASLAPVSTNTTDAGRARNRRVELVVQ